MRTNVWKKVSQQKGMVEVGLGEVLEVGNVKKICNYNTLLGAMMGINIEVRSLTQSLWQGKVRKGLLSSSNEVEFQRPRGTWIKSLWE